MSKTNFGTIYTGWIIILLTVGTAAGIYYIEGFNSWFLILQLFLIVLTLVSGKGFNGNHTAFARIILGLLFMMSGFVKGVDPLGTAYRIEDYFIAYGMGWAEQASLVLSVILNGFEFFLGFLLLFNIKPKITSVLLVLTMILFTATTLNDALNNPVPDCGCFGDAIKLSNWQTLYKNLSIDVFVIIIAFYARKKKYRIASVFEWISVPIVLGGFICFEVYCLNNLPVIDFSNWKEGKILKVAKRMPVKSYVTYENIASGEKKEYLSSEIPWNDSVWMSEWKFVITHNVDPNPPMHDLTIEDESGTTVTDLVIENPDYQLLLVSYDINLIKPGKTDLFRNTIDEALKENISFILLTSSLEADVDKFRKNNKLEDWSVGYSDDTVLKAMIRSNPGLILLKNGKILKKWHYRNIPSYEQLKEEYLKAT